MLHYQYFELFCTQNFLFKLIGIYGTQIGNVY